MSASSPTEHHAAVAPVSTAVMTAKEIKENKLHTAARRPSHSSGHRAAGDDEEEEIFFEIPEFSELAAALIDESAPIAKRMRCCFLLKQLGDEPSIDVLSKGLRSPSVLLGHECGYVLGQLQNKYALPKLYEVLSDASVNPIIRHECAEAIGAIGAEESMDILVKYSTDANTEVAETCLIAIDKLKWNKQNPGVTFSSKFCSVDPAPRTDNAGDTIEQLQQSMMNTELTLFERYRSMFALRDRGSEEAVLALGTGFKDKSPVFRHEVAYVMGQMQHPAAIEVLKEALSNESEHAMVRHEAAEALGSIASETLSPFLKEYQTNEKEDRIVRESCDVALDLVDYWNSEEVVTAVKQAD